MYLQTGLRQVQLLAQQTCGPTIYLPSLNSVMMSQRWSGLLLILGNPTVSILSTLLLSPKAKPSHLRIFYRSRICFFP